MLFSFQNIHLVLAVLLVASSASAKPFSISSLVYRRSATSGSLNQTSPSRWNANDSAIADRVFLASPSMPKRDLLGDDLDIWLLGGSYYKEFASCSPTKDNGDDCVTSASSCQDVLDIVSTALRPVALDTGLAYYDRSALETLIKHYIDYLKRLLERIALLSKRFPVLGERLYPIVYKIKCILELLLDGGENLTDALVTPLNRIMECFCGTEVVGLCMLDAHGILLPLDILH